MNRRTLASTFGILFAASAPVALAQNALSSATCPRVVTIQEEGKPPLQCRVLKTWPEGSGVAFDVEVRDPAEP